MRHLPRRSSKNCDLQSANGRQTDRLKANYSIDDLAMASDTFTPIMYADDTTLLSILDDFNGYQITNPNFIQTNAELTKVMDWLTVNKLSLNI